MTQLLDPPPYESQISIATDGATGLVEASPVDEGRIEFEDENRIDLEIVIPTYNENQRISSTLFALSDCLSQSEINARICVIDNGSTDGTADTVDAVARATEVPVVVQGCSRQGKGAAVARGMIMSTAKWVGFCDADLATPPDAVHDAIALLREGWPIVIGSREAPGAVKVRRQPILREAEGRAFRRIARGIVKAPLDTQCGFKFFDGEVARKLFPLLRCAGFAFDVELLALAQRTGIPVKELPVMWQHCDDSTFRPLRDGLTAAGELWRLRGARTAVDRSLQ